MKAERDWIYAATALTALCVVLALGLMPRIDGLLPALRILPVWMLGTVMAGVIMLFGQMALNKVESPAAEFATIWRNQRGRVIAALATLLLAGLNMVSFIWVKTLLNYLVPFWADPMLARADAAIFLGHDPWRLLAPYVFPQAGQVYHPLCFLIMIVLLVIAAWAPKSPQRSAVLMSYFLLWSVAGPLVHCLLPAGGPIFYEAMGYGPRFADITPTPETAGVAQYLWATYSTGSFGAGSGISAMPSMHVTMAASMVIASAVIARRILVPVSTACGVVALLSVALGWHYALDGIVGSIVALAVYRANLAWFTRRDRRMGEAVLA